ncbi:MAG: cupredoxin domain-containing protein [Anaerolineae bacterium]
MKKLISSLVLVGLLLASLGLVGIASAAEPVVVTITLNDYTVEMSQTDIPANTPVSFVAINNGALGHEVVLEKAGVVDEPLEIAGAEAEIEDIEAGATKEAVWTIAEPGQYQLACHLRGHYEHGMVLAFTVTDVPAATPAQLPATGGVADPTMSWLLAGGGALLIVAGLVLPRRLASPQ